MAGLTQRINLMQEFNAVTGFQDDELPLLDARLSFLSRALDPTEDERRFDRVVLLAGLPDLHQLAPGIDVDKLLKLRASRDWTEFRSWLRQIDTETDSEIEARFTDVRAQAAAAMQSTRGRAVRFVVTLAAGFLGLIPGLAVSTGDAFLVDRLLGRPGPAVFLGRSYPSIFRESPLM